jgi:hypothetical protein
MLENGLVRGSSAVVIESLDGQGQGSIGVAVQVESKDVLPVPSGDVTTAVPVMRMVLAVQQVLRPLEHVQDGRSSFIYGLPRVTKILLLPARFDSNTTTFVLVAST